MGFRRIFRWETWQAEKLKRRKELRRLLESSKDGSAEKQAETRKRVTELMGHARLIKMSYRMFGNGEMDLIARVSAMREDQDEDSYVRTIVEYHRIKKDLLVRYPAEIATRLAEENCYLLYGLRPKEKAREVVETMEGLIGKMGVPQIKTSLDLGSERKRNGRKYFETLVELSEVNGKYYGGNASWEYAAEHIRRRDAVRTINGEPVDEKIAENILKNAKGKRVED